jgi:hypothetical protein
MMYLVKGIVARLKSYIGVTGLISQRTYFDVPQGATFPYLSLSISGEEAYSKTSQDTIYQIVVNSWSRDKSPQETLEILSAVKTTLDHQEAAITIDSGKLVMLQFVSEDFFKDPDGVTWHGVSIYNAYYDYGG